MRSELTVDSADISSAIRKYSAKRFQTTLKGALDFVVAALLVLFLAPLLLLIACIIRFQDGGRVIYRRRVVGPKGEFDAYKFRTMRMGADEVLAADPHLKAIFERNFKLADDPRITSVGLLLRKYSLDELPQLLNVLKGEMSLVGPRMITVAELKKYGEYGDIFLKIKPGLTGYWQVNGRQRVSYDERVQMDVSYVEKWSLLLDFRILCKTPLKVMSGDGAY